MTEEQLAAEINRLRSLGSDDAHTEAKECARKLSKDVWESVSAFANTEGGTLLLGLSERNGFVPVDHFELESVCDAFITGMGDGDRNGAKLVNPPHYTVERVRFDGKPLLVIQVDELDASHKPCYKKEVGVSGGSYKRVDDADIPLSANEIYSLSNVGVMTGSDSVVVPGARVGDLDDALYVQAFARARQLMPRAMHKADDDGTRLQRLNFVNVDGTVTKAGLLAAGMYPQQFYPKLCVDVAVHAGTKKASSGPLRFIDRAVCTGPIGTMIADAVAAVAKNLRRPSVVNGVERIDLLEIPEMVIREAITNALVHRDYDARFDGEAVSVDIFDDRIEVINPGGLWGKTRDELADGRSVCRNPTLMNLMYIVPVAGGGGTSAEGNGTGIPLMIYECTACGLREPTFTPSFDYFKVTLWRPSAQGEGASPQRVRRGEARNDGTGESGVIGESGSMNENGSLQNLLAQYGELSTRELQEMSGLSKNQVRARVNRLIETGVVMPTAGPTSRRRKYRLAE